MVVYGVALLMLAGSSVLLALDTSQCIAPLGMETGRIPDTDISASSSYNDGNVAPQNGRLNQDIKGGAWCPRSQITAESIEWLEVDLHAVHVITSTAIQGRFGNGLGQEYAETYMIEYWRPRLGKWIRYRTRSGQEVLPGNTNTYLEQKNELKPPIFASKLRMIPYSSHLRTVCMRIEIYGCLWTGGIVSYSMPTGDARSNGVELLDVSYDGTWNGGMLRGGLGQLVDGEYGGDEIREAARVSTWVGWRNDSHPNPPSITFEFDHVREFRAVHIYCNNRFMRDVRVFAEAVVTFSLGGLRFQDEPVRFVHPLDKIFESSRNVSIGLHHRIGRWVRIELRFAAHWILISEVVFESELAQGNHSVERVPVDADTTPLTSPPVSSPPPLTTTTRRDDPLYVAIVVGVLTALVVLLSVAVYLIVHRHRHRKCSATPHAKPTVSNHRLPLDISSACGTANLADKSPESSAADLKCDEYQEPYQACPYLSTVLLEMNNVHPESPTYEYAVPEVSSAPLLGVRPSERRSLLDRHNMLISQRMSSSLSQDDVTDAVRRRLDAVTVAEFPRHRLRMISKLAEGAFGTVYVAEADGVPLYEGGMSPDKQLVAVKFLNHDVSLSERYIMAGFERDVSILSAISHPCMSRVVGACRSPPLAVVMEYLGWGELYKFLRTRSPPPPSRALHTLSVHLADGMRYLESLDFVHRDLAARNCLVGPGYQLKICDFATDSEAHARDYYRPPGGRVPVPLRWSSWEAALAERHSSRSDVWAFAVTLYEIYSLCRRRPYDHMTDNEVLNNLSRMQCAEEEFECLPRPGGCPRDVYELMLECWRREGAARPPFREVHKFLARRA